MKRRWPIIRGCLAAAAMVVLILDTKTALAGAQKGLNMCLQTVIPSLFPFFVLSILVTGAVTGRSFRFLAPLRSLFRVPPGSEGLLAAGLVGGYPVGAQCVSQAFENGQLSGGDASRLLVVCNNCGPAFLFGMTAAVFNLWYVPWLLWGIQIISSLAVAWVVPSPCLPVAHRNSASISLIRSLDRALKVMAAVCGWVILFRVIIAFLDGWVLWLLPLEAQVSLSGVLELSNGCFELYRLNNMGLQFIICAGMLNFGGICVALQTAAVTAAELDGSNYLPGKVLQCAVSVMCAWIAQRLIFPPEQQYRCSILVVSVSAVIAVIFGFVLRKKKNSSSIPEKLGV